VVADFSLDRRTDLTVKAQVLPLKILEKLRAWYGRLRM
jgi:hypothetical protein